MLSLIGYLSMLVILALLIAQKVSPVVALAGVPIIAALIAGESPANISEFVSNGIAGVADVAVMFIFAIVFFGILRNAKFFDPIIDRIIGFGGSSPTMITVATTMLACIVHLDGAGATTFLVTIPAMLPVYQRLGMSRLTLSTCVALGAGVMNLLPWGGPTARAATAIDVDPNAVWVPLIPAQIAGVVAALAIAWYLGYRESRRNNRIPGKAARTSEGAAEVVGEAARTPEGAAGVTGETARTSEETGETDAEAGPGSTEARPVVSTAGPTTLSLILNAVLLVATLATMMTGVISPAMTFMVATIVALLINQRGMAAQSAQFDLSAKSCMLMASTLLAAGVLLGILDKSGMIDAMASTAAGIIPAGVMPLLPIVVAILGVPMSLLFGPDAYYFGILPILAAAGQTHGIDPLVLGQASVIGEETLGFPISPMTGSFYLLVGLAGVPIGQHIRKAFGWVWLVSIIMTLAAIVTGVIPLWVS